MHNRTLLQGIGIGMAAGAVVGMMLPRRRSRTVVGKTMRSMGNTVDRVAGSLKL